MRSFVSPLLLLGLLVLGANAQADPAAPDSHPKLSVTGSASVTVEPDVGKISVSITVGEKSVGEACGIAANTTDAVIKAAEGSGPGVTVTTTNINVQPNITYGPDNQQINSGFTCTQSLLIEVEPKKESQLDAAISAAVDATLAAGGNYLQVSSMESALSDGLRRTATNQAREKAVEDAAATADILAKAAKVTLGDILSITDSNWAPPSPVPLASAGAAMDSAEFAPTPVQTGTTDVLANVAIEYAISSGGAGLAAEGGN